MATKRVRRNNLMKIKICLFISLLCSLGIISSVSAEPQMRLDSDSFDFGTIPQKTKVSHIFWIHSTGTDSLRIVKVIPGCGCTKMPLEKEVIAPGDSTWLEIQFNSKIYSSKVTKRPRIITNTTPSDVRLTFHANVTMYPDSTYPLVIDSFGVNLSGLTDKDKATFTITNHSDKDYALSIIEYDNELFKVKLPKKIKAEHSVKGTIQLLPNDNPDTFNKSVTIELGDTEHTRYTIPVFMRVSAFKPHTTENNK